MPASATAILVAALAIGASALSVPTNVRNLYNSIKAQGSCSSAHTLASGFWSTEGSGASYSYCGDHLADYNIIYLQGPSGQFVNMDIDCDGTQGGVGDDGRCGSSKDTQSITSFQDTVSSYNKGVNDLNAFVHPYVVFGNAGSRNGFKTFDPQAYGVQPLSIMAVVCGDKMFYGIWGDENGDDGDHPMVGEASISMATACYGTTVNGDAGHDENDVLYIAFPGSKAVPGANGAKWSASSFTEFHNSIQSLGDSLVAGIGGTTTTPRSSTTSTASTAKTSSTKASSTSSIPPSITNVATCSWAGHCAGATCTDENDCSDDLICISGVCGSG
ncbi:family 75 glycoside hydrolase [Thozetella sp. PMI_491]|nr:family 75 glycoside hydrolase [Thozetella sp. PMI_491]